MDKIKRKYEKLREKYKLPKFEKLDSEFEISAIEPERLKFLMRAIIEAMCNRLHKFIGHITPIINPEPASLHSMVESKLFEKEEAGQLFKFYKQLWHLIHKGILFDLKGEKERAAFIREVWDEWPKIKAKMEHLLERVVKGWAEEEKEDKFTEDYLG